ncbi:hypothetical protein LXD69_15975 [Flavobacterium sediminilitoris]|uniref:Tetratricopeptide repeat protein n=1 Tax=Flavobacterium sediminilitoris TaxID=2024526 RepID=A0ABY4HMQ3_9FLAO|nr:MULTISPECIES: hypothetical protein [Flavobacterium]UOX33517.1 hypothetical protein LXD69_15975 [Flavobacterium sediminilitoris]
MKSLFLTVVLFVSMTTFAQKDELKTLKKIYFKENISNEDLKKYKESSDKLISIASSESDKKYAHFFKVIYPTIDLASKGVNATMEDQIKLFNPDFLEEYGKTIDRIIELEQNNGKYIYSDDLKNKKADFRELLNNTATKLYKENKFREASLMFHNLYIFDTKNEGLALENSAQLSIQAGDYLLADRFYDELKNSDYLKSVSYYAINKMDNTEDLFPNKEARDNMVSLGTYEKPRDEKLEEKKGEVYKMIALVALQNKNIDKAKEAFEIAKSLNVNDEQLINGEFQMYFSLGYDIVVKDKEIVDEINKNLENKQKFDELMNKRKELFKKSLPYFEKALELSPEDQNTKKVLKMSYEVLEMKDKAEALNQ